MAWCLGVEPIGAEKSIRPRSCSSELRPMGEEVSGIIIFESLQFTKGTLQKLFLNFPDTMISFPSTQTARLRECGYENPRVLSFALNVG